MGVCVCLFRITNPLHPEHIQPGTYHNINFKDNSVGNVLNIHFIQYFKHLIAKHKSLLSYFYLTDRRNHHTLG